jgi:hypothetical protein
MTAIAELFTITDQDRHATIGRCYAILTRARRNAWQADACVMFAMAVLRVALKDYALAVCGHGHGSSDTAVLVAETAAEHLIATIRRVCGDDEADYVGGAE